MGFAATVRLVDDWYVGGGFSDANARAGDIWNFNTFSKGEYASIAYLNYRGCVCGLGKANYQFNMYSVDGTEQAGFSRGLSLILEQNVGQDHIGACAQQIEKQAQVQTRVEQRSAFERESKTTGRVRAFQRR